MAIKVTRRRFNLGMAAVAGVSAVGLPGTSRAAVNLKYGNAGNPNSVSNRFAVKYFAEVERRTNGEVTAEIFAGNLGLGEKDLIEGMALGTIDVYSGAFTGTREFDILYTAYMFRDDEHAGRVANGSLRDKASAVLESLYGARYIGVGRAGPWALFLNEKVDGFDGLKGLKIRAPQIEGVVAGLEHLGAEPTVIPFNEVKTALQQGVVDGMATLADLAISQGFFEVVKYMTRNDFGTGLDKWMIAVRSWDRLSEEQQQIMLDTFNELEETDYYLDAKNRLPTIHEEWEQRNGPGSVLDLDATAAQAAMAPLNQRLADEVYGAGTWDVIAGS
jgi:TRAP-type C4-dicarboxylate transport system substrate-binding protein